MVNSFIFLADLKTGTSLQGLCSPSPSLSTLVIISLLFSISKFLGFGLCLFCGIVLDDPKIYLLGLAVFNILKAFLLLHRSWRPLGRLMLKTRTRLLRQSP
ncbi:unnamed protein product [Brassica rapa subsp. trilocularis]